MIHKTQKFISNRFLVSLFVFLISSFSVFAKTTISELLNKLQIAENDAQRLTAYNNIFNYYEYSNTDSFLYYSKQGLAHFTTNQYKPGIAAMLSDLGAAYSTEGLLDIARKADEKALNIYTELHDKAGIANTNNILGVIEGRKKNYLEATNHFLTALNIYKDINDTVAISDTYLKLGTANEKSDKLDKALEYYNIALSFYKGKPVNDVVIFLNNNIGLVYYRKNDTANAMKYLELALNESEDPQFSQIHMLPLQNISDLYAKMGDTTKAINFAKQALDIAVKEHTEDERTLILLNMSSLYIKSNPTKALSLLKDALQIAEKINDKDLQVQAINCIVQIYKQKEDFKRAFEWQEKQQNIEDSIIAVEKVKSNANLEAFHNLDQLTYKVQNLEIAEQKQQQKKKELITISLALSIILIIVIFYYLKTKQLNIELHNRQVQLNKSSKVKNKLISIIAHDLIGSIGFMPLSLRICRNKLIPESERDSLLNQIELNAVTCYETLQNMLDWGKAQIQGITLSQSKFTVSEIVSEILKFVNIAAYNKQIDIINNIKPNLMVFADANHFKFIIRNLLNNAIKFTNKNGVITINAEKSMDSLYIVFSVKDNGIGIDEEELNRIFEPLGHTNTGTDNEKGNGIGLNLCKEYVIENGGKIWVESIKNKGSMFYFTLKAGN